MSKSSPIIGTMLNEWWKKAVVCIGQTLPVEVVIRIEDANEILIRASVRTKLMERHSTYEGFSVDQELSIFWATNPFGSDVLKDDAPVNVSSTRAKKCRPHGVQSVLQETAAYFIPAHWDPSLLEKLLRYVIGKDEMPMVSCIVLCTHRDIAHFNFDNWI